MIIETARMWLRPVTVADVEDLVRLDSDPEVMRYVSGGVPTPREVIENWVVPRAEAERRSHSTGMWAAIGGYDRAFLGWLSLRAPRHSRSSELELTYRLHRSAWGRGLATEAASALIATAFQQIRADRVFASTTAANVGSRRVMEKVGMRLSAIHLSDAWVTGDASDDWSSRGHGEVEYEVLRTHWETTTMTWSTAVSPDRFGHSGLTA
ncbi:GNAT family N-acetyltransferase [Gordonia soli]|uniref:Putative acetyltransferase n=1 Tax=Gordonia soli NBRC 108243 TaxID=1223545 RepID=M0QLW9_9ACTN|nr:GNAT family N-acetyltransferase [Gordonia soli]GAC69670.1 putative acetyltransferase [Gordonia soli NBRC 108243]